MWSKCTSRAAAGRTLYWARMTAVPVMRPSTYAKLMGTLGRSLLSLMVDISQ